MEASKHVTTVMESRCKGLSQTISSWHPTETLTENTHRKLQKVFQQYSVQVAYQHWWWFSHT